VYEIRALKEEFGPRRGEVKEVGVKLHNVKLHNLHCSPSIIRMIKSRKIRWTWDVACRVHGEKRKP
jgi:hypothetical protein